MIYFSCFVYWCFISPSMLKSLRALPHTFKNETRIARMRRILSFHGFFIVFWIWIGFSCAYRRGISPIENNPSKSLRPTGAHNPCESNRTSVKEQIRCIRAIRVSLNACGRRIAMSTRKLKYQWIKIWGKMDNDIFFLFCLLMFYLPINAQEPSGSSAHVQKWNTDSTDATDFIFSRILYCLLDLNRIFLRLSARDFSYRK